MVVLKFTTDDFLQLRGFQLHYTGELILQLHYTGELILQLRSHFTLCISSFFDLMRMSFYNIERKHEA